MCGPIGGGYEFVMTNERLVLLADYYVGGEWPAV